MLCPEEISLNNKLILIKHSLPGTIPEMPASQWQLNDEGRRRYRPPARRLKQYLPASLYSSAESKAVDTAMLLGKNLGVTPNRLPDLEEHHHDSEPFLTNLQQFHEAIDRFFANPSKLTYGTESADQGVERFDAAAESAIDGSDARKS